MAACVRVKFIIAERYSISNRLRDYELVDRLMDLRDRILGSLPPPGDMCGRPSDQPHDSPSVLRPSRQLNAITLLVDGILQKSKFWFTVLSL